MVHATLAAHTTACHTPCVAVSNKLPPQTAANQPDWFSISSLEVGYNGNNPSIISRPPGPTVWTADKGEGGTDLSKSTACLLVACKEEDMLPHCTAQTAGWSQRAMARAYSHVSSNHNTRPSHTTHRSLQHPTKQTPIRRWQAGSRTAHSQNCSS